MGESSMNGVSAKVFHVSSDFTVMVVPSVENDPAFEDKSGLGVGAGVAPDSVPMRLRRESIRALGQQRGHVVANVLAVGRRIRAGRAEAELRAVEMEDAIVVRGDENLGEFDGFANRETFSEKREVILV